MSAEKCSHARKVERPYTLNGAMLTLWRCPDCGYHEGTTDPWGEVSERRVADEPWRIPARVGVVRRRTYDPKWLVWDWGHLKENLDFDYSAWRRMMGRRRSDWIRGSKLEGRTP